MTGASRIAPIPASSAPITQAIVDTRRTGMPSSWARALFSADARIATPYTVRRRNHTTANTTIGPTTSTITCCGRITTRPKVKCGWSKGTGKVSPPPVKMFSPAASLGLGRISRPTVTTCATPTVAISTISRGLRNSRWMTVRSMIAATAQVAARLVGSASQ